MSKGTPRRLTTRQLHPPLTTRQLRFDTTGDLPGSPDLVEPPEAMRTLGWALKLSSTSHQIYVVGPDDHDSMSRLQKRLAGLQLNPSPPVPLSLTRHQADPGHVVVGEGGYETRTLPVTTDQVTLVSDPSSVKLFGRSAATVQGVRAGLLHQVRGGTLLIRVRDLSMVVFKRLVGALTHREAAPIRTQQDQLVVAPLPVDLRVVLVGSAHAFHSFHNNADFARMFRVRVDIPETRLLDNRVVEDLAKWMALAHHQGALPPLSRAAVQAVVAWAVRESGRGSRIRISPAELHDLVVEAAVDAGPVVDETHVEGVLEHRRQQRNQVQRRIFDSVFRGFVQVDVDGSVVGQVNGLAVYRTAGFKFGRPLRLTVGVGVGRGGMVNIEREAGLSGKTHDKGVHILAGFLRTHFGRERSLALTASVCFEQNYGRIDGDSASTAELIGLLSAISKVPVKQSVAITGAVDQLGAVQPIGSVNDKIEGFFDICAERGLTGGQGVVIPRRNVIDLRLAQRVVDACADGQFHVWPVDHVDQALRRMVEVPVGACTAKRPKKDSFYGSVIHELEVLEETLRRASKGPQKKK